MKLNDEIRMTKEIRMINLSPQRDPTGADGQSSFIIHKRSVDSARKAAN
jgi:hypothetical protein